MAPFRVFAEDVYFKRGRCESRPRYLASPHGARVEPEPAAIPELPRPRLDWRDGKQLWLWSYPERRPRTFAYCQSLGLGDAFPCAFASCRHSLLSDELMGETRADVDPWTVETCSLAVASRRRHSSVEVAQITGLCESTTEEWLRRARAALKRGLGLEDVQWPPQNRGFKIQSGDCDGLAELVAKMPERPKVNTPPVKILTREQVAALYGRKFVSPSYGQAKP
jgi:hypothetical protein